ncbi:ErfK/YbiS/YcfS/YnhG family protein [Bifidobacterium asteroides PRL2011]|nr:ErfK/YbiS/YcfS/YnhG family protein [Bifidobacterium asteroides PRL2011]
MAMEEQEEPRISDVDQAETVTLPPTMGNGPDPVDLFADGEAERAFGAGASHKAPSSGHRGRTILALLLLVVLILVGCWFGARAFFRDRVAPGVTLGGQVMMGRTKDQVSQIVDRQVRDSQVEIKGEGTSARAGLKDLGVSVDSDATVTRIMDAKGSAGISRLNPFHGEAVPLVAERNQQAMDKYLTERFVPGQDRSVPSTIVFDQGAHAFRAQEGRGGKAPELDRVQDAVSSLIDKPGRRLAVGVVYKDVTMPISLDTADKVASQANQRLAKDLVIKGADDDLMTVPASTVATWVKPVTDLQKGTMELGFDRQAIKQYLDQELARQLNRDMVTAVNVKNTKGDVVAETTKGVDGVRVTDVSATTDLVVKALQEGDTSPIQVKAEITPHKEQTRVARYDVPDGDTWIRVNLSDQTATAYHGTTPVKTFPICSGKPRDDRWSDTGTFFIYLRHTVQTMRGDGYVLPNITWVSYYNGDEGFHTANWNSVGIAKGDPNNYGSHGCINMYEQDAKWIFDNAPVGTMVKVEGQVPSGPAR